ncbi:MAG TPA: SO_0444 family Cu/Zn efflux transporter [Candidatus Limnocylindrales bacterium]|nr:SO_0444 family Cu/Zn efflux transporter [Candidatus Limnocylindrales bacterium]
MIDFLFQILQETWIILKEASVFLLFGYLVGVLIILLIPARAILTYLGTGKIKSVFWASLIGVPMPLCSCGVVPTALSLKKQGANNGATVSFLISTPEMDVDTIFVSYALMDPIMATIRPIAAFVTAVTAGIVTNFWGDQKQNTQTPDPPFTPQDHGPAVARNSHSLPDHHSHALKEESYFETVLGPVGVSGGWIQKFYRTFQQLIDDTSYWVTVGVILSGVIAVLLPASVIEKYLRGGFMSMLVMLLIGIPMYTCATASTPIAATLILKGLNPGAALIFLLSGPATNLGTIVVLLKFLGRRVVALYLGTIVVVSLLAGYVVNWIYWSSGLDPRMTFGAASNLIPESIKTVAALGVISLFILSFRRTNVPEEWIHLRDKFSSLTGFHLTAIRIKAGALIALAVIYLYSGFVTIQPGEIGVKLRFGKIIASNLAPGLHYHVPWPIEKIEKVHKDLIRRVELGFRTNNLSLDSQNQVKAQTVTEGSNLGSQFMVSNSLWSEQKQIEEESFFLTGDENIVDINLTVHYKVKDPVQYAYRMNEPDRLVRSFTLSGLREVIGQMKIDAVLTIERGNIERKVQHLLQEALDAYEAGIEVLFVQLLAVDAPREVHSAFRDVASAQEDKLHIINRALTFAEESVNQAKGEAAKTIQSGLAFKEEKILKAQGDAQAFTLRNQAYQISPELNQFRLYLETMETILPKVQKTLRPGPRDIKDVDLWRWSATPAEP